MKIHDYCQHLVPLTCCLFILQSLSPSSLSSFLNQPFFGSSFEIQGSLLALKQTSTSFHSYLCVDLAIIRDYSSNFPSVTKIEP